MDRITGRFLWKLLMHKTKKVTKPIHPLLEKEKVCPPPKLFIYSTALVSSGCMHVKKHVSVFFWDIFYVVRNQKDVGLQWYFEHESTMYHCRTNPHPKSFLFFEQNKTSKRSEGSRQHGCRGSDSPWESAFSTQQHPRSHFLAACSLYGAAWNDLKQ